jgi:hypothetical protein
MGGRLKKLFFATDEEGKQVFSVLRAVTATITTLLIGALFTWGQWVHTQAYTVAINKKDIVKTGASLAKDIDINRQDIIMNHGEVKDEFNKNNGILHKRITKVDDKYDAKIAELNKLLMQTNTLIVEMLIQKNKEIDLKKEEVQIQQKILDDGHNK